jgi:hypothetical protein
MNMNWLQVSASTKLSEVDKRESNEFEICNQFSGKLVWLLLKTLSTESVIERHF